MQATSFLPEFHCVALVERTRENCEQEHNSAETTANAQSYE